MGWAAVLPGLCPPGPRPLPSLQPLGPRGAWQRCRSRGSGRGAAVLRIRPRYVPRWGPQFSEAQRRVPGRRGGRCGFLETRWGAGAPRPRHRSGHAGYCRACAQGWRCPPPPSHAQVGWGEEPKPGSGVLCPPWPGADLRGTPLGREIVAGDSTAGGGGRPARALGGASARCSGRLASPRADIPHTQDRALSPSAGSPIRGAGLRTVPWGVAQLPNMAGHPTASLGVLDRFPHA